MTTFIRQQPGLPASEYSGHVERVLSKPRRPVPVWLLWLLVVVVNLAALFLVALTLFL